MRLICRHSRCELLDMVLSIPFGESVEPCVNRVVLFNACGVDETVHVSVPRLKAQFCCPHRHIVSYLFCQRLKALIIRVSLAILSHSGHQILAHLEVLVEEDFCLHHLYCVLWDSRLKGLDLVFLQIFFLKSDCINNFEGLFYQQFVCIQHRMLHRHALSVGQGDALIKTECCNLHQQCLQAILVGQFEIMSQDYPDDKLPFQSICSLDCTSRHEPVTLP